MVKYILGGGFAGMIFAYYNPDYFIISPNLGGQAESRFNLGPRVLEKSEYTEELLKELGLSTETEKIRIGFYKNGFKSIEEFSKDEYLLQSRGKVCKEKSGMNGDKSEMEVYKTSFKELSERLADKLKSRHVSNSVDFILLNRQALVLKEIVKPFIFQKLVSTVPSETFLKLCNKKVLNETEQVTFVKLNKKFFDMQGKSFIYFLDEIFYRLSDHKDYLVAEIRGEKAEEDLEAIFGNNLLDFTSLRTQVISSKPTVGQRNIILFGRYAEQDKSIKVETLIEKAKHLNSNDTKG